MSEKYFELQARPSVDSIGTGKGSVGYILGEIQESDESLSTLAKPSMGSNSAAGSSRRSRLDSLEVPNSPAASIWSSASKPPPHSNPQSGVSSRPGSKQPSGSQPQSRPNSHAGSKRGSASKSPPRSNASSRPGSKRGSASKPPMSNPPSGYQSRSGSKRPSATKPILGSKQLSESKKPLKVKQQEKSNTESEQSSESSSNKKKWRNAFQSFSVAKDVADAGNACETDMFSLARKAIKVQNAQFTSGESVAWLQRALKVSRTRTRHVRYAYNRKELLPTDCPQITKSNPLFDERRSRLTREMFDFERTLFQQTMRSMGGLKPTAGKTPVKDKGPYHCSTGNVTTRHDVEYHPVIFGEEKKEVKRPCCNAIDPEFIPTYVHAKTKKDIYFDRNILNNRRPAREPYFPKSTVRVRYPGKPEMVQLEFSALDSVESRQVCKYMARFGPVLFITTEGKNSVLVTFEYMRSAYKARISTSHPKHYTVEWLDSRFESYGHLSEHLGYEVSKDKVWRKAIREKTKPERVPKISVFSARS